jgi:hypothetical protein
MLRRSCQAVTGLKKSRFSAPQQQSDKKLVARRPRREKDATDNPAEK